MRKRALVVLAEQETRWPVKTVEKASDAPPPSDLGIPELVAQAADGLAQDLGDRGDIARRTEQVLRLRTKAVCAAMHTAFTEELYNKVAAKYAADHAYDRGVLVDIEDTQRQLLGGALKAELEAGHTFEETRRNITGFFGELEEWETLRIARTEIATAATGGSLNSVQALSEEHGFKITGAIRLEAADACDSCEMLAADSVAHPLSMDEAMTANLEAHPNCRRDWVYEMEE